MVTKPNKVIKKNNKNNGNDVEPRYNRPFSIYLVPLFQLQEESSSQTFRTKKSLICMKITCRWNTFSYEPQGTIPYLSFQVFSLQP